MFSIVFKQIFEIYKRALGEREENKDSNTTILSRNYKWLEFFFFKIFIQIKIQENK